MREEKGGLSEERWVAHIRPEVMGSHSRPPEDPSQLGLDSGKTEGWAKWSVTGWAGRA